jgi:hypothetical protein
VTKGTYKDCIVEVYGSPCVNSWKEFLEYPPNRKDGPYVLARVKILSLPNNCKGKAKVGETTLIKKVSISFDEFAKQCSFKERDNNAQLTAAEEVVEIESIDSNNEVQIISWISTNRQQENDILTVKEEIPNKVAKFYISFLKIIILFQSNQMENETNKKRKFLEKEDIRPNSTRYFMTLPYSELQRLCSSKGLPANKSTREMARLLST